MYYRILYSSTATDELTANDIIEIVNSAKNYNGTKGITGMLLFIGDNFLQYLEGDEAEVSDLYAKIARDKRHTDCKILLQGRNGVDHRHFEGWNMGMKILTEQDMMDAKDMNNNPEFDLFQQLNSRPDIAKEIMKYFYNNGEVNFRKFWTSNNTIKGI